MSEPTPSHPLAPVAESLQTARESVRRTAGQWRDAASQKASDLKASAAQRAAELREGLHEHSDELRDFAGDALKQAVDQYEQFMQEAESLAREKPRKALYTAFGVGLVIGLLLRR
jgi:ElaB/YqjD/DUF883 family membrane-anchored ribosome-binding protein